ncbi:response regulator receiver protein [Paraburkholderia eburnea]|uniref:Response regulator receiver protein n=1 Tax=Paraburkholderia eburnea TaxID=1189126 RepID=A0A2S4MAL5_9BURK|nr:AAA family ATPase [Paraburkholderia eburnea]POR51691.1 response regulator receiver protein [Paraburkholderia eburnea]PRZ22722.1 response regulator receiver protein [Paraburkholderia eburnea]
MIDILTLSTDSARLAQIVNLVGECGNYRTTRVVGDAAMLLERGDSLDLFDMLIVDAPSLDDVSLTSTARLCREHRHLTCILVAPDASPDTVIAAMRAGFRDVLGWPLDRHSLEDALLRAQTQHSQRNARETQVVSFVSCKGGVGTSFIASNVAHALSTQRGKRVLLVDLCQLFGDAAFLVTDETPPSTLPQMCAQVERMDGAFFGASVVHVSDSFDILAGAGDPVKAADIKVDRFEWILGLAVPRYDFVIVDVGQTLNPLSILALDRSTQIHLVLQATMPGVRAARRLLEILVSLGYAPNQLRLLLNRYTRHDERTRAALEQVLGMKPNHVIPEDARAVLAAVNQGMPIAKAGSGSVTRSLQDIAAQIAGNAAAPAHEKPKTRSLFARLRGDVVQSGARHVAS